ncbi:T3SS effector HopA1 family protein [Nitrosarchaeum sp. AC2]|uniref:T3SS effector HopA1 family protein n=1 Tax=Nitrosarchaeum sp. AC2 TaxID=2259673 RepID=UPI0015CE043C|nr:T3SS effector HopA1 family protein [Nitrosarchaeum sp. AC2]QLH11271.1 hypothetical protein DSQ20_07205 [Nitrosarchaeum sp. AC2]
MILLKISAGFSLDEKLGIFSNNHDFFTNKVYELRDYIYAKYHTGLKNTLLKEYLKNDIYGISYDPVLLSKLQKSNKCTGYYDFGWRIMSKSKKNAIVEQNHLHLMISLDDHLKQKKHLKIGDIVSIKFPKDRINSSNGFYTVISNFGKINLKNDITRIYFNTNIDGISKILKTLTKNLTAKSLPFIFKTLVDPKYYIRNDSSVLYIEKTNYKEILPLLQKIHLSYGSFLYRRISIFSKLIFPGIAIAEEPDFINHEESFGQHRSRLIAQGMLNSYKKNNFSKRIEFIIHEFEKLKLNIDKPYLNPKSEDIY